MPVTKKKYTQAQKLAYYKKKAAARSRPRRTRYMKGHGAYRLPKGFFTKAGQTLGGALGGFVAPGIGSVAGEAIGALGGMGLARLLGQGDYTVQQNSFVYPDRVVPSFGEDSVRIRKREMIALINSTQTGGFQPLEIEINPGLSESFPWCSAMANLYENYRINGLVFQFVSTTSDAIASTTNLGLGQVIMGTDYACQSFVDSTQMLGSMFANSGKPSENIMHAVECAPSMSPNKLYFVRSGAVPSGRSILDYDIGKFTLALSEMPAAYSGVGMLFVSYDITFSKSVQNNVLGWNLQTDFWNDLVSYSPTNAAPFGSALSSSFIAGNAGSNLGCTINSNTIFFPDNLASGYYQVIIQWVGTAAAITAPVMTRTGCKIVNCFFANNSNILGSPVNGVSSVHYLMSFIVKLTGDYATGDNYAKIVFASGILPSSITRATLLINQVNGDIFDAYTTTT